MRGEKGVRQFRQAAVEVWLFAIHIQAGAKKLARRKRLDQRILIHQRTAGRIHEYCAARQQREHFTCHQRAGTRGAGKVQRQDIASRQQILQRLDKLCALFDLRRKESTVRTVLHRLEEKGFVTHAVEGRTYVFQASRPRRDVAARAVQRIADWPCNGSVEEVLVGMVDADMLEPAELRRLADKIAKAKQRRR
jgi:predicted transcriptional regulator